MKDKTTKLKNISKILLLILAGITFLFFVIAYMYSLTPAGREKLNINNMGIIPTKKEIPFSLAWIMLSITQFCCGIYLCIHKHKVLGICIIVISIIIFLVSLFNLNVVGVI